MSGFGAIGLIAASDSLPRVAGSPPKSVPDLSRPEENLEAVLRVTGSLREEDVPWWYDGTIYGMVGENGPTPLIRFEGMELYWVRHLDDGEYELIGNTVTFFRDIESGRMIDRFSNPYTGEENAVPAAVQGGGPGRGFNLSVNGVRPTKLKDKIPDEPLKKWWSVAAGRIWMNNDTVYPPGLPPPRAQGQSMFATVEEFNDPELVRIPGVFSSTVTMPWQEWMEMGDRPGHLLWHAAGVKLASQDQLPAEYRKRAEAEYPERMVVARE